MRLGLLLPDRWNPLSWLQGRDRIGLRALSTAHAGAVARLHAQGFARSWDQPEVARMIADPAILSDGLFLGDSRAPSAFVMSRLAADEAEILTICVDSARRGRGLSAMLLAHHRENLARKGVERLFLEVDEANAPALRLYRRAGFVEVGRRPGYYPRPDGSRATALVMRLDL